MACLINVAISVTIKSDSFFEITISCLMIFVIAMAAFPWLSGLINPPILFIYLDFCGILSSNFFWIIFLFFFRFIFCWIKKKVTQTSFTIFCRFFFFNFKILHVLHMTFIRTSKEKILKIKKISFIWNKTDSFKVFQKIECYMYVVGYRAFY